MVIGGVGALIMLFALASLVLLIMALVDLVGRPTETWTQSGQNQLVWVLIVVFVGFIGPLMYLWIARPALDNVAART